MEKSRITEAFQNPKNEYRAKPFWAWNGELKKEELLRQIDIAKEMGFGGFFMHSRTGLATEYLGEEWFELTNACADYAKKKGMEAWLYDEDRWPSGTAGGMVTKEQKNRMRHIRMERGVTDVTGEQIKDALAAFLIWEENGVLKSYTRVYSVEEAAEGDGELVLFFSEEMACSSFYNGYTYADTLNKETTQCYIEKTHAKYLEHCGERIGTSIQGIFTDEPHRGGLMTSFGQGADGGEYHVPFTPKLPKRFQESYGYDLIAYLPELFLCTNPEHIAKIKWQFVELVEEMFLENFAKPIDAYCRENGMILTGHILHENNLTSQTAMSGSMMRYYVHMEYPGIDFLGQDERCYWIAKQLQSVARQFGKTMLLSELDGCTGWQMSFEDYKKIGDWQALYGINLRCPHLSWYTMEGQAKRDYPASIFHQSSWWKEYAWLEEYYARIAQFLSVGKPDCHVLVLHPVESIWAQVRPGWCQGLSPNDEHIKELEEQFARLFFGLQQLHIDFDYGDEGLLKEYASVKDGKLRVGQASYDVVIVSGMDTIRTTTTDLLKDLVKEGGRVIVCGDAPAYRDCEKAVWDVPCEPIPKTKEALAHALQEYQVSIVAEDGKDDADLLCQMNQEKGTRFLMLLNDNRKEGTKATVRIKGHGTVTRFVPETGDYYTVESSRDGEDTVFAVEIEAAGSRLYTIGEAFTEKQEERRTKEEESFLLKEPKEVTLQEDNICVLDFASVRIDEGEMSAPMEILKADRRIRTHYGLPFRGGEMFQPWFVKQKHVEIKGQVQLFFDFYVEDLPENDWKLVLESPQDRTVLCNGQPCPYVDHDFYWADQCFHAIALPSSMLKEGKNTISVEVSYSEATNLEAMYLFGDFSVRLEENKRILCKSNDSIQIGDLVTQGFPFYSGKITYRFSVPKKEEGRWMVSLNEWAGACVKVTGNGKEKLVAFEPYEVDVTDCMEDGRLDLTVVLTRRNTFGPLHHWPVLAKPCGPMHFETEGEQFRNAYSLMEAGLLRAPILRRVNEE